MDVVGKHELQWGNDLFVQAMTDKEEQKKKFAHSHTVRVRAGLE